MSSRSRIFGGAGPEGPGVVRVREDALDTGRGGTSGLGSGGPEWDPEASWTSMGMVGGH